MIVIETLTGHLLFHNPSASHSCHCGLSGCNSPRSLKSFTKEEGHRKKLCLMSVVPRMTHFQEVSKERDVSAVFSEHAGPGLNQ